ncbi:Transmembrane BAX inhibitor motif-containing protein 4 [Perkinsus chesapeaki]|uniref:Transmembrane BAX inhibitor motif-containing protein 4 n=1 Tax=Perkinsus chesapeaki TaxID=330153 RepID=A0A7J6LWS8_PERCH|nr:Transmembrane BAX inhibitor motif-containing protein 4 [Perkinsus chesapeaki]
MSRNNASSSAAAVGRASYDIEAGRGYEDTQFYPSDEIVEGIPTYVRHNFIKKVYSILSLQLILTAAIATPFALYPEHFMGPKTVALVYLSVFITIGIMIAIMCAPSIMRNYPTNYIVLTIFTLAEGFMVGIITSRYEINSILLAVGIVAIVVMGLTAYAFQTKHDFTGMGPYLFVATLVLALFGLMFLFFGTTPILHKVYAGIGALIFSMYLVFDTQLIAGGKHTRFSFSLDDYCFAAISLYIDIIQLFIYIISLVGNER